jgi:hypothetical protein
MAKNGTLTLDGFKVRAEVVAPGLLVIKTKGGMFISRDEIPEKMPPMRYSEKRNADAVLFTSRKNVIRRILYGAK